MKLQALQREGRTDDRLVKQIAGSRAMLKLLQEECVASVAVALMEKVPGLAYVCEGVGDAPQEVRPKGP